MASPRPVLGRILVVDDDCSLRTLLHNYLARCGYAVTVCPSAEEALRLVAAEEFRLLIADLTLPRISGEELVRRACEADPQLRALLLSGYPFDLSVLPEQWRARVRFLQKPFLPEELSASIRALLEDRAG
ncbi:MAG: response regulator [Bryobacteraceae bacterium]|jgi:DNA-binding response OmpR family regulator|nr:response regulator [Bryobacteraceae bacterium]